MHRVVKEFFDIQFDYSGPYVGKTSEQYRMHTGLKCIA